MPVTLFSGPCGPRTPAEVRRSLAGLPAAARVPQAMLDDLALVLTELVSNAVDAGARSIQVALTEPPPHLHVAVTDDAQGVPVLRAASWQDHRGRGLAIIEAIATSWGYTPGDGSKTVWAKLPT